MYCGGSGGSGGGGGDDDDEAMSVCLSVCLTLYWKYEFWLKLVLQVHTKSCQVKNFNSCWCNINPPLYINLQLHLSQEWFIIERFDT